MPWLKRANGKVYNVHCVRKIEKLFEHRYSSTYIFSAVTISFRVSQRGIRQVLWSIKSLEMCRWLTLLVSNLDHCMQMVAQFLMCCWTTNLLLKTVFYQAEICLQPLRIRKPKWSLLAHSPAGDRILSNKNNEICHSVLYGREAVGKQLIHGC